VVNGYRRYEISQVRKLLRASEVAEHPNESSLGREVQLNIEDKNFISLPSQQQVETVASRENRKDASAVLGAKIPGRICFRSRGGTLIAFAPFFRAFWDELRVVYISIGFQTICSFIARKRGESTLEQIGAFSKRRRFPQTST